MKCMVKLLKFIDVTYFSMLAACLVLCVMTCLRCVLLLFTYLTGVTGDNSDTSEISEQQQDTPQAGHNTENKACRQHTEIRYVNKLQ